MGFVGKIGRGIKNTVRGLENLRLRKSSGHSLKPRWLVFMAEDKCNSRCVHCSIWKHEGCGNILKPDEIEKALSDPLFENIEYVIVTGGEPTLRSDLTEMFQAMHNALPAARLQLSTNALLPDRALETTKELLEAGIPFDVGVSLDGVGDKHDEIRGVPGNFKKADELIGELVKLRGEYGCQLGLAVGIVISDLTLDTVDEVREFAKSHDVELVEAWYNEAGFYDNDENTIPTKKLEEVVRSQEPSLLKEKWVKALDGKSIKSTCFALHTFLVMRADGEMVPCLNLFDESAGNIRDRSPTQIWGSQQAKKVRSEVRECSGCLNAWASNWSYMSSYIPTLSFRIRHPQFLLKALTEG